ncbi:hypothetical protein P168DRAFT_303329 [Aspergillus campestris IBT 28561]|uniref:Apple domain-containing protein n=1 Tax=Aspergillus campestris (strain IBT 28561) TaxID=1392248 RepID=A0A2I1D6S1_ASPC2|nr:uncharacterized protein P168DRAFT_303329 [Aspergillus campestris IBT 28561]PKY05553.1 hypothetical protein P168DRAFT_303329 [Aspergillus campestris IBT 28561]
MKIAYIIPALGMAHSALATVNAGPYNSAYAKYCGSGQSRGTVTIDQTVFSYVCDTGNSAISKAPISVRSLDICADLCESDGACDKAVWFRDNGNCWLSTPGSDTHAPGQIAITRDRTAKPSPDPNHIQTVPPVCNNTNSRQVTRVSGQGWFLACGTRFGVTRPNQVGKVESLERCIDTCNQRPGCRSVMWNRDDRYCYVTDKNSLEKEVTQNASIDAAIKIE